MASENCNICFQKMAARRELPCKHALCIECVKNMIKTVGRSEHLSCPNCRGLFSIAVAPIDSTHHPQYVREKYKKKVESARDVGVIKQNKTIMGMAVISDELFIICKAPSTVIFKYDIGANSKQPWLPVELSISEMIFPTGIAASETSSCLYITDWHTMFGGRLWRYKYRNGQAAIKEKPVAILDEQPFGVSVSKKTDQVIVTCATPTNIFAKRGWIYIYKSSGSEFQRIEKIELPYLEIPRHSILTSSSKVVVCHGRYRGSHGVTSYLYDERGQARKQSFYGKVSGGGSGEQEMNRPMSMIQDEDGLILVVDYCKHRIQLLTEDLQLVRHLITSELNYPRHICQHAKTGRIYVGQEDGSVQIFDALIVKG